VFDVGSLLTGLAMPAAAASAARAGNRTDSVPAAHVPVISEV
jgi:hypothetical protein